MTTIVTRAGKGSPLTHTEVDTNFTNLNTNKLETAAIPLGTAAAPSISFLSDANTGIYSPGADQLAVATNGTQRLSINASGVVTFISDTRNATLLRLTATSGENWDFKNTNTVGSTDVLTIGAAGATANLALDDVGRVGIGTTSPGAPVNIVSNHSVGTLTTSLKLATVGGYAASSGTCLDFGVDQGNYSTWLTARIGAPRTGDNYGGSLVFYTNRNTSATDIQEAARIDSSGRLLVGTSSARSNVFTESTTAATPTHQIETAINSSWGTGLSIINNSSAGFASVLTLGLSSANSVGSNTLVPNGNTLGRINFAGNDGTNFVCGARIAGETDGTTGSGDLPSRLVFSTTADGASSPTERARINSLGAFKATTTGSVISATSSTHEFTNGNTSEEYAFRIKQSAATSNIYPLYIETPGQAPNNTTSRFITCADSAAVRFEFRSNGGIANFSGNNVNLSDRNAKKDISPAADTWNCIKEWEIVNYRYKDQPDDADLNLGVIAQQVAESCPEVITIFQEAKEATEDKPAQEERLGVKEQQMYWMAIKALQEAMGRIEALEADVAQLKGA